MAICVCIRNSRTSSSSARTFSSSCWSRICPRISQIRKSPPDSCTRTETDRIPSLPELQPAKRIILELTLPPPSTSPELLWRLLSAFIRLTDHLVANAHFRPEVLRKSRQTREEEARKLKKVLDEETKEEREIKLAEKKKAERDARLRNMTAAEQKKFLEKEREKERKDAQKKASRKA